RSCAAFDALPAVAVSRGWAHLSQGGVGRPVRCCHAEVNEKHWLFPNAHDARPIEIALGPLRHGSSVAGCDLRPSRPALTVPNACCATFHSEDDCYPVDTARVSYATTDANDRNNK